MDINNNSVGEVQMNICNKKTIVGFASLLTHSLYFPPALAASLEEVIVTAQKHEENIQLVPIAMTAMTSEDLTQKGIVSFEGIARDSPSINVAPDYASGSSLIIFMRGMGTVLPSATNSEGAVGIYQDGFYIARSNALTFDLADPERIEVLRGPQGTLYGRNTTGGAINIVSKHPQGEFDLKQVLEFGNRNYFRSMTAVDLPEWNKIATKITLVKSSLDGWVRNTGSSHDYGEEEQMGGRIQLRWQPTSDFILDYFGEMTDIDSTPGYFQNAAFEGLLINGYLYSKAGERRRTTFRPIDLAPSTISVEGHGLTLNWDINDSVTVKSLTGYREYKVDNYQDYADSFSSNSMPMSFTQHDKFPSRQLSQEFQLSGSFLDDSLTTVAGLYYLRESGSSKGSSGSSTFISSGSGSTEGTSSAIYGQLTWTPDVLDQRLSVTLGARYTDDHREGEATSAINGFTRYNLSDSLDFDSFDPALIINFRVSEDINTYAKVTTGYRSGGVYFGGTTFNNSFDPEELTTYELGIKTDWFDQRLRFNADVFLSKYDDMQIAITADLRLNSNTYNIGEATVSGFEMDLLAAPLDGVTLNLSYVYLDPEFDKVDVIAGSVYDGAVNPASPYAQGDDIKDLFVLPYASRHSVTAGIDYSFLHFSNGYLNAHIDYRWQSEYYSLANAGPDVPGRDFAKLNSYGEVNARLTMSLDLPRGDKAMVSLWGKNIANEDHRALAIPLGGLNVALPGSPAGLTSSAVMWSAPASYGISITYEY